MAKYEQLGYCPHNSFMRFTKKSRAQKTVEGLLGKRSVYMVYDKVDHYWEPSDKDSIVNALYGGSAILGIQVATYLDTVAPEPLEENLMIVVHDIINPLQADENLRCLETKWFFDDISSTKSTKRTMKCEEGTRKKVFWDERYMVLIEDTPESPEMGVHIYLLRTLPAYTGVYLNSETVLEDLPSEKRRK